MNVYCKRRKDALLTLTEYQMKIKIYVQMKKPMKLKIVICIHRSFMTQRNENGCNAVKCNIVVIPLVLCI